MSKDTKAPPRFLFLEFLDSEINALLTGLRNEFGHEGVGADIHITVRGPYDRPIPRDEIIRCQETLGSDPILIHGAGVFDNPREHVVYTKVRSPGLRRIWSKPDFPPEKYGFNPHISLYKGLDAGLARAIYDFLRQEDFALLCHKFRLTPYASRQGELFPFAPIPIERHFLELANRRLVRPDILQRAANLMRYYRAPQANSDPDTNP